MSAFTKSLLLVATASGCMLGPTDDQRISNPAASQTFHGYTIEPRARVQVKAWDFAANAMANVGLPAVASSYARRVEDHDLYEWSVYSPLASRFWRPGPAGGQCAIVGATTTLDEGRGNTYNVMTVESDWGDCYADNQDPSDFYQNCGSSNNPLAKLYTTSWGSVDVTPAMLSLASLVASPQFSITLDNYTPTAYQFCNSSNPAGCPAGGASDPETWKYYRPNGSSITFAGSTMTFSIEPSRRDPMTIYLDNMSNIAATGTRLVFSISGDRLMLRINFESADPEIRMNCIRNGWCAIADGRTIDFTSPLFAELRFALTTEGGKVTYSDVTTTVSNGNPDGAEAAASIADAITEKLMADASIRSSVSNALDTVIHQIAELDGYPIENVSIVSGNLRVLPGCPKD